jgi:hypothetical protein
MCHGGACKYADGGAIKGVNKAEGNKPGESFAGERVREAKAAKTPFLKAINTQEAKDEHKVVLREQRSMPGPTAGKSGFAEGGKVPTIEIKPHPPELAELSDEQVEHARKRFAEKPSGKKHEREPAEGYASGYPVKDKMAEGGEVEDPDTELSHGLGKELLGALDSRDHKAIMSCMEACIAHHMSKGDEGDDDV